MWRRARLRTRSTLSRSWPVHGWVCGAREPRPTLRRDAVGSRVERLLRRNLRRLRRDCECRIGYKESIGTWRPPREDTGRAEDHSAEIFVCHEGHIRAVERDGTVPISGRLPGPPRG